MLCLYRSYNPAGGKKSKWLRVLFIARVITAQGEHPSYMLKLDNLCDPDLDEAFWANESMVIGRLSESQFQRAKDLGFRPNRDTLLNILGDESGELASLRLLLQDITA